MVSYPAIWINRNKKIIILTNHRVGTFTIRQYCKISNYKKIHNSSLNYKEYNNYKFYLFVRNPYSRFISSFHMLCSAKIDHNLLGNVDFQNLLSNIKKRYFNKNRKLNNINNYLYCLNLFIGNYDLFYKNRIKNIDGHWIPQTNNLIYNKMILNKCTIIKFEELNLEKNKLILKKLFNIKKLLKKHSTNYKIDKNKLLNKEVINLINKYYYEDFIFLNYNFKNYV